MKKLFMLLTAVMMLSMTVVSVSSCGNDDDTESYSSVKNELQGTWKGQVVTGSMSTNSGTKYYYDDVTLKISGNTINIVASDYNKTFNFTIGQNGNYYLDLGEFALFFQISGNTLKITSSNSTAGLWMCGTYTKQ